MPRKAMVAGVFLSGLLFAGCEWCGNCKGLCGKEAGPYVSTQPRSPGTTASNPIIYNDNLQTPSSRAANPSGNRFATTGTTDSKGGIVPASGTSTDPSWSRKPSESWSGSPAYTRPAGGAPDSEVPAPEDPEARTPAYEPAPSLQRPSRPASPDMRPDY